jgi:hypothetical protein
MSSSNGPNTSPNGSTQSVRASLEEAAEEFLPGMARLEEAKKAVMVDDLRRLVRDDREAVRRYREKTVFGQDTPSSTEEPPVGNLVVAETIHFEERATPRPPKGLGIVGKLLVAASLLAGGAGAGVLVNELLSPDPPAAVDTDTDTTTDVTFPE